MWLMLLTNIILSTTAGVPHNFGSSTSSGMSFGGGSSNGGGGAGGSW